MQDLLLTEYVMCYYYQIKRCEDFHHYQPSVQKAKMFNLKWHKYRNAENLHISEA